jgi:hypothetical protein
VEAEISITHGGSTVLDSYGAIHGSDALGWAAIWRIESS